MEFGEKLSIEDFKAANKTSTLQVVKNPKNGNLFVTANGKTVAAVSQNYDSSKGSPEFVELVTDDGPIWCLHNASESNVVETL